MGAGLGSRKTVARGVLCGFLALGQHVGASVYVLLVASSVAAQVMNAVA